MVIKKSLKGGFGCMNKKLISLGALALSIVPLISAYSPGELVTDIKEFIIYIFGFLFQVIIGEVSPDIISMTNSNIAAYVVTIAIWALIFVTFGDIIQTFSSFNKWIAWLSAFFLAVIAANVGIISGGFVEITQWFVWFGTGAVYAALGAAFLAFVAVNLGLTPLHNFLANRRMMMEANSYEAKTKKGATKVQAAIDNLADVADKFEAKRG